MMRSPRRLLSRAVVLLAVVYASATGFLALRETSMVFPGLARTGTTGVVPDNGAGILWDSLRVEADDGVPVFLIESRLDGMPNGPWIIFFHGNGMLVGDRGSTARYELLARAGFNVLAVEFRGYGASAAAPSPSEKGVRADARAAWTYLTDRRRVEPHRIAVYGWSLGSGAAVYLATEMNPGGVVTEGAFTSLPDIGADLYPWLPIRLVMRNRFDNLARAADITVPWLILHGRADEVIPFSHAEALVAAAGEARLIPLTAGHNDGVMADPPIAFAALRELALELGAGTHPDER